VIRSPIARTGTLNRKTPLPRAAAPAVGKPRTKKCGNRACRAPYEVDVKQPWKNWCSDDCAVVIAIAKVDAQKAKKQRTERAQDKAKLDGMKTYPQLVADCQKVFNAVVRQRDQGQPCICCGRTSEKTYLTGSNWDCGHFRSTGSAPHLRFNFDNAHRQLVYCNRHGAGRAVDYRLGLIARIGLARVEALEADNTPAKWTHDDLRRMTKDFRAQLKQLKESA
jgi:hypothetical protein